MPRAMHLASWWGGAATSHGGEGRPGPEWFAELVVILVASRRVHTAELVAAPPRSRHHRPHPPRAVVAVRCSRSAPASPRTPAPVPLSPRRRMLVPCRGRREPPPPPWLLPGVIGSSVAASTDLVVWVDGLLVARGREPRRCRSPSLDPAVRALGGGRGGLGGSEGLQYRGRRLARGGGQVDRWGLGFRRIYI